MHPLPDQTKPFAEQEITVLVTQLLFGEALNQADDARAGVGCAARNRLIHWRPEYGDWGWQGILLKSGAFDCFVALKDKLLNPLKHESQDTWDHLYDIAATILNGTQSDNVERSTFYFDSSLDAHPPFWARPPVLGSLTEHVKDIGDLRFIRYIEHHSAQYIPEDWGEF